MQPLTRLRWPPINLINRHQLIPAVFVLFPCLSHVIPWLLGLHSNPLWVFGNMTSPWHPVQPGLLPGVMFLDPNVGFTTQALGGLAARDWLHGVVPWWNPYTGIGMPLAGEMQPGAFFLPFSLLLALSNGVLCLTLVMQAVSGLTTYALLRKLGCSRTAAMMGGLLYELNSTIALSPGPTSVFCAQPFLPLVIWGIERASRPDGGPAARLGVGVGIAYMILAGFPEPAYVNGLLALCWFGWRLAAGPARAKIFGRVACGGALGLFLAAPLLVAFADVLVRSDAVSTHLRGWNSLPFRALGMTVLPYVYGTPSAFVSAPFDGSTWSGIGFYMGLMLPVLALAGLASAAPAGLRVLLTGWVILGLAKMFGFGPALWLVNQVPAMQDIAFCRYAAPSMGLALVILAAFGVDRLRAPDRLVWPLATGLCLLAAAAIISRPVAATWHGVAPHRIVFGLWALSLTAALAVLAVTALAWLRWRGQARVSVLAGLAVCEALILFFPPLATGGRHGTIELGAVRFLQTQSGFTRSYTLGPVQPNYGAYFRVAMINHNMLPVPRDWADYVDAHVLPGLLQESAGIIFCPGCGLYGPGAGVASVQAHLPDLQELGVGFVVSSPLPGLAGLKQVYADPSMGLWAVPAPKPYFEVAAGGPCAVTARSRTHVQLACVSPAILERRELFMPGWTASVDGATAPVRQDGPVFEDVDVPAGRHDLRFSYAPPYEDYAWPAALLGALGCLVQALAVARRRASRPGADTRPFWSTRLLVRLGDDG